MALYTSDLINKIEKRSLGDVFLSYSRDDNNCDSSLSLEDIAGWFISYALSNNLNRLSSNLFFRYTTSLCFWGMRSRANCCLGFRQPSITYHPWRKTEESSRCVRLCFAKLFLKTTLLEFNLTYMFSILHRQCTRCYNVPKNPFVSNFHWQWASLSNHRLWRSNDMWHS